jgi:hypothetical protein
VEEVWPGRHANSPLARKRLDEWALRDRDTVARFKREVAILRTLGHPNIIEVVHADLDDSDPWFLMPLATANLTSEIPLGGLEDDRLREIFSVVLDAIEHAHQQSVIHRDLKPENVLIVDGSIVVSDFGLGRRIDSNTATLTVTGFKAGTEGYAAPEQWVDFHKVDHRADIYALGALLYNLATGRSPLAGDPRAAPPLYRRLIDKCREHDPRRRYQTVTDLREDFVELWLPNDEVMRPAEHASIILQGSSNDIEDTRLLMKILLNNRGDDGLYLTSVPMIDSQRVQSMIMLSFREFEIIIDQYCSHLRGFLDFESLDPAARFLRRVYNATNDISMKERVITKILTLGSEYDRYNVGRIFGEMVGCVSDRAEVFMIRDVLRREPVAALWSKKYIQAHQSPSVILTTLTEIQQRTRRQRDRDDDSPW